MSNNLKFTNQFHDYGLPKPFAANPTEFMVNIQYLEEKINATTKELTYWDIYRISTVLADASAFQSAVNNLLPYESMVINTKINTGGEDGDYNPGDIVIKKSDGTHTKIKAERGGIFYPSQITKAEKDENYTYTIDFSYQSTKPSDTENDSKDNKDTTGNTFVCDYAEKMIYSGLTGNMVGSPYNRVYTITEDSSVLSLDGVKYNDTNYVAPIVKCFTGNENDTQLEEVYCDIEIIQASGTYTIKLKDSSVTNLITKVVVK